MIQRLVLLTATLLALFCESAYGLGLGNLELKSALNQEFSAEIKLVNTKGLAIEEVLPSLASQEDFDRVGVERNYLLLDLRFRVRVEADGTMVVLVRSNRPIIEPFLNFIVEVLWPTGRILKEYTVLLDPPIFGQQGVAPISPTISSSSSGSRAQRRPIPDHSSQSSMAGSMADDGEYGMTATGDTLWSIARMVRPDDSVSMQQMMLALQRANSEAFIGSNINLLKAGHILRIPDMAEIMQASTSEALTEVQIQNEEFEEYKDTGVAQLDATRRSSGSRSRETSADDGELRLLASNSRSGQRAGDSNEVNEELENELAVTREDLDRSRRANSELNVRMDDLTGQLETLNEIVILKDDQLAALRAQVQKSMEAGDTPVPAAPVQAQQSQSLLSNPLVLGGLVFIFLVISVVIVLVVMRRRQQSADLSDDEFTEVSLDDADSGSEDASGEAESEASTDTEDEDVEQQTSDAISEAEIYIAYGRFPQAITFLQNAIEQEPSRTDIQVKLLEVYVQTEDATAFNLQFEQLKMLGDEDATAQATSLQAQIPGASESAEAAMEATIISTEPIAAIEESDDDDDLSFDLDDLDSETEDDELNLDLGDELDLDDAEDMELDLELDDDQDATMELDSGVDSAGDDDLELDLADDLDLDLDLDLDADEDSSDSDGDDDDTLTLELDDEEINLEDDLDLGDDDDDVISLDLDDGEIDFGEEDELDLGDDDLELDLGDDDLDLQLSDDDLDLDDDLGELNLDDDGDSKLDLARAYVEMGSNDEARAKLQEVIAEGSEAEIKEANELLEKLD